MSSGQETPRAKRNSVFRAATVKVPGSDTPLTGRARDVSCGGARLELIAGLKPGMMIDVAIGGEAVVQATVIWSHDDKCGVAFDRIDTPSGSDAATRTDGIPTSGWIADLRDGYRR